MGAETVAVVSTTGFSRHYGIRESAYVDVFVGNETYSRLGRIKALTGGDAIRPRQLFCEYYIYILQRHDQHNVIDRDHWIYCSRYHVQNLLRWRRDEQYTCSRLRRI